MSFWQIIVCFLTLYHSYGTEEFDIEGKFLYFAYGSNLLQRRIHINNPSATFFKTAKLLGYRLDFNIYVESWEGAVATIVEDPDSFVWGALWILDISDMNNLDTQEGIHTGLYYAKNVSVATNDGIVFNARTYLERLVPPKVPSNEIPIERQPSATYMKVIIQGALECSLPIKYIEFLFTFPTNGKLANWNIRQELGYPFNWISDDSLFPHENGAAGKILHAIQTTQIALVDNAPKGTQLKLLLLLEGKQKIFFKPKRYNLNHVVNGNIYAGFDRHNSEVFAYYLAMVLNFRWIAPSIIRRIHLHRDIVPFATMGLKKTMIKNDSGSLCIYGKCFYCRKNETVCPDHNGEIEGAAILYLDRQFKIHKSPWRRSYSNRKMEWEIDNAFCNKVKGSLSTKLLLNLIDVAIFDFLIQNGDRHRFEVYKDQIILLDNGKGLGNPSVDELDILAPLYQCCMISPSTWQKLEMVSGGSLTSTIKLLAALQGQKLATEEHFKAVERRLLKVYATIQYCIGKYGRAKVLKNWLA